ncbi:MAG: DNA-binding protein [Pelovirga sp.]
MKTRISFFIFIVTLLVLVGCQQNSTTESTAAVSSPEPQTATNNISGSVVETMDAIGYTYVLVETDNEQVWAATPQFEVSVGDMVVIPEGMAMHNYYSQTLDRQFDVVYFVESILNASAATASTSETPQGQMPEGHPPISGAAAATAAPVSVTDIDKLEGGMNIEEIYNARSELSGQEVKLRGQVVKFSPQIMGTNWIHLQDGSGSPEAGTHDLTLTSNTQLKVGDVVVASGKLTVDKDFGHGYAYDLIVENAVVNPE